MRLQNILNCRSFYLTAGFIITGIAITICCSIAEGLSANLAASYSFETNLRDGSGNGNDAIGHNIKYSDGKIGKCLELDGTGYLEIPYSTDFDFRDKLTIEMWINRTKRDLLNNACMFGTANARLRFWITTTEQFNMAFQSEGGGGMDLYVYSDEGGLFLNQWQHITWMIGDGIVAFYLDGRELTRENVPAEKRVLLIEQGSIYIGGIPNGERFLGKIDEIRISRDIALNVLPLHVKQVSYPSKHALKVTANSMGLYGQKGLKAEAVIKASKTDYAILSEEFPSFEKGLSEINIDVGSLKSGIYNVDVTLYNGNGETVAEQTRSFEKPETEAWHGIYDRLMETAVPPPWTPVQVNDKNISIWGRTYTYNDSSVFPAVIRTLDRSILSGPIRLIGKVGLDTLVWNTPSYSIMEREDPRAVIELNTVARNLEVNALTTIEYDGMIRVDMALNPLGGVYLDELALEIPFKPEHADYFWNIPGPWTLAEPYGRGLPYGVWQADFRNYIWIGDGDRGFCWFADSHRNWYIDDKKDAIIINKSAEGTSLLIYFVNKSFMLNMPRTITFGMMATPVKPRPKGWRKWRYGNSNRSTIVNYWANPNTMQHYFFPIPHSLPSFDYLVDGYHAKGQKFTAYSCNNYIAADTPEWKYYKGDWDAYGSALSSYQFNEYLPQVCPSQKDFIDYFISLYDTHFKTTHADGIYIDTTNPLPCENPDHEECHYIDNNGDLQYDFKIFTHRKIHKGIYTAAKNEDPENVIVIHMSRFLLIPSLSFCDAIVDGEQFWHGFNHGTTPQKGDYMESSRLDIWITEFSARQFGLVQLFLPELQGSQQNELWRIRGLLGLTLLHDCRLWEAWIDSKPLYKKWDILDDFGIERAEFIPYWSNNGELESSDGDVKVSAYYRAEREALLVITNVCPESKEIIVSHNLSSAGLSPEMGLRAVDAESEEIIRVHADQFQIMVPGKDYRLIRLQSPDAFLPEKYFLSQNYPNPFNAKTAIKYSIPEDVRVSISIFNILGQEIIKLVDEPQPAGDYTVEWDGKNGNHLPISSGVYFYRFKAGEFSRNKKMVLIK